MQARPALRADFSLPQSVQQRTARFVAVLAIAELAGAEQGTDFRERFGKSFWCDVVRAEVAESGGVDQITTGR